MLLVSLGFRVTRWTYKWLAVYPYFYCAAEDAILSKEETSSVHSLWY